MSERKPLEPLIPLDKLKEIVQKIARVPKEMLDRNGSEPKPKRKAGRKKRTP